MPSSGCQAWKKAGPPQRLCRWVPALRIDLLSTAVALHALDAVAAPWRAHRDTILDFLDSLWSGEGGFHGSWADDQLDCEYTFYGLLALGHASR